MATETTTPIEQLRAALTPEQVAELREAAENAPLGPGLRSRESQMLVIIKESLPLVTDFIKRNTKPHQTWLLLKRHMEQVIKEVECAPSMYVHPAVILALLDGYERLRVAAFEEAASIVDVEAEAQSIAADGFAAHPALDERDERDYRRMESNCRERARVLAHLTTSIRARAALTKDTADHD